MPERRFLAVFIGRRKGEGQLLDCWQVVNDDGTLSDEVLKFLPFKKRKGVRPGPLSTSFIGYVYWIKEDAEERYNADGERVKVWNDDRQRAEWRLLQDTAEAALESEKKAKETTYGELTLDELKKQYGKLIGRSRRAALLAAVAQYITA